MAVLGRILVAGAQRLDLPDVLSIDSFVAGDFKYLIKSLVGDQKPYVLTGLDVINPGDSIGGQTVSIRVANSVLFYPQSSAGPFFYGLEEGRPESEPLIPELRKSAINYVYATFDTFETARDSRAFWDPDKEGGQGGEFNQDVNTQDALRININVSTASFPEGTVPIAKVVVGANFIESIEDARDQLFRLGTGGLSPNPLQQYNFRADPDLNFRRAEPNTLMTSSLQPNPFQGGDKNIKSLKEWMDVVMTKLAELGGTAYWYEDVSSYNLVNMFQDIAATEVKSKGQWELSESAAGQVRWTEDLHVQSVRDLRSIIIRSGQVVLDDEEVLWIEKDRDRLFNDGNLQTNWISGQSFVNGISGAFENLSIGDWVKKPGDPLNFYRRVEAFYFATNLGGGLTSPDTARSIQLSSSYPGITEPSAGVFTKGEYTASDLIISSRTDDDPAEAGGDFSWLAARSDFIQNISNIESFVLTFDISQSDSSIAKCRTSSPHGLTDGERITIASGSAYAGTYTVEAETDEIFYISLGQADDPSGASGDETGVNGYYALVTTTNRTTQVGFNEDSAAHNFRTDQVITLEDTVEGYDGDYRIFVRSQTTFTVPIDGPLPSTGQGDARQVRVNVRKDLGSTRLLPGDIKYIGEVETENLQSYIGQQNAGQTSPQYRIPGEFNALNGQENYNSVLGENLTERVSRLSAMMADKAQDKTIVKSYDGFSGITNTLGGSPVGETCELRFVHLSSDTPQLRLLLPGSFITTYIGLTGQVDLKENEAAYFEIHRNQDVVIPDLSGLTIAPITEVPINENIFIFAIRFDSNTCWLFDGNELDVGYTLTQNTISDLLNSNNYDETIEIVDQGIASSYEYRAEDVYIEDNLIGVAENTVAPGNVIPLPEDTRNSGQPIDYVIGKGTLEVSLNGQVLTPGQDWQEEAPSGGNLSPAIGLNDFEPVHLGTTIIINRRLFVGDKIRFRLGTTGGHSGPASPLSAGTGGGGEANTLVSSGSAGDGLPLNNPKIGTQLFLKRLQAGNNISLSVSANNNAIIIDAAAAGESNDGLNLGGAGDGAAVFATKTGTSLAFRRIRAGNSITVNQQSNFIEISADGLGEENNVLNLGAGVDGQPLVSPKTGTDFFVKRIRGNGGINVTSNANSILISTDNTVQALAIRERFLNSTGVAIPKNTPVCLASDGSIVPVNIAGSNSAEAQAFIGITSEEIADQSIGFVAIGGILKDIGAFSAQSILYVARDGTLTTTVPEIGQGTPAFQNEDYIIEVGLVTVDPDDSSQSNLLVRPKIVGRL